MVIRNDFPFAFDNKAGTENVNLKMRPRAARIELCHAFVVDQRFAGGIDGDLDRAARLFVEKLDDNVQQANAGAVILDYAFGNLALALQKFQAVLRVRELAFSDSGVGATAGDAFVEIFRLGFQRFASGRCGLRLCLEQPAGELRAALKLALLAQTAIRRRVISARN